MLLLSLAFLGPFAVRLGNQPVTQFESDKVRALLVYLAVEAGKPHRRSALAGLLWRDYPESAARASLRNALANLRQVIQDHKAEPPFLLIDNETVQFNPSSEYWLDVRAFEALLTIDEQPSRIDIPQSKIENFKSAVSLFRGSFLQGFSLKDSPAFDEWTLLVREELNRKVVFALSYLAQEFELRDDFDQACTYTYRLVSLEPWHEEAHRQLMRLLALNGQRAAALAQYEICRRNLREELDVEPDVETIRLYEQIRDRLILGRAKPKPPPHNLPARLSRCIGREDELRELLSRLEDPTCRLLTLVGPGGCGKTRLAIEAAYCQIDHFKHGVYFVELAGIQTPQAIPQALGQVLGFSFRAEGEPWQQLLDYFRQKQMLLVLDNFEHLLEGAGLVIGLLLAAPGVKTLVTSRTRLNIMEESLLPLGGMEYPTESLLASETPDLTSYAAIRLFLEGARRVKPGFMPGIEDLEQIGAICRLVAGMPLAVLLSASWAGLLSPAEIVAQIQQHSMDFLETEWCDVPERHRSLRLVFDHSWKLISGKQQEILAGLSVFQSSFTFQAARSVVEIELHELRHLVDCSMVLPAAAERFDLHLLMRQYASDQLGRLPGKGEDFHDRHCAYFIGMLARWATALQGPGQRAAQREIEVESENIRQAWEWALGHAQYDRLVQAIDGMGGMYERLCLYRAGEQVFQNSATNLKIGLMNGLEKNLVPLLVRIWGWQSLFSRMLGNNEAARQAIESGMNLLERQPLHTEHLHHEKAFLLQQKGLLEFNTDRDLSQHDLTESLELYRLVGNTWREAQVLTSLAMVANAHGHYQKAEIFINECLAIQRALGDTISLADTLIEMSTTLVGFGDFRRMALLVHEHAVVIRELGSPALLADNLVIESVNLCYLGRFAESARPMEEAIEIYDNLGNRSGCMLLKCLLGWFETNEGFYDQGYENHQASLTMARQLGDLRGIALNLLGLSEIYVRWGEYAQARQFLEESVTLFYQVHQEDELCLTLAELADVEFRLGLYGPARSHFHEALQIAAETGSWQAGLYVIGKTALIMAIQGDVEKGIELYTLARRYPYLGNSCFWEDTAGKRITDFAAELPEETIAAAKERGMMRELNETVRELLGKFDSVVRD